MQFNLLNHSLRSEGVRRVYRIERKCVHLFRTGTRARVRVLDTAGGAGPELSRVVAINVDVDRVSGSLATWSGIVRLRCIRS